MQNQQQLEDLANAILAQGTPDDSRVLNTRVVQGLVISIERHHNPFVRCRKCELIGIWQAATPGVLRGEHIHTARSQSASE